MRGPGKRPIKCQRCGSERVRLFATAAPASTRLSPGYLRPLLPAAGPGGEPSRARTTTTTGGGRSGVGGPRSNAGGGTPAVRHSSAPFGSDNNGNQMPMKNGALAPMSYSSSSADHSNKISGWSDNGRPGTDPRPSLRGRSSRGGGTAAAAAAAGREGGIVVDLRGRIGAAHVGRMVSPRPPPRQ